MAKSRTRPMPGRPQMPIAALLSAQTRNPASMPKSRATDTSHRPSADPSTTPASSASAELRAIVFWVVDQRLIVREPHMAAPPQVERRAAAQPAKSVSA
eukprot:3923526-Alexandrium_andersonii.AAC.1